jgi:hypothetical protein
MLNKHTITELIFLARHWTVSEAVWVLWCCRSDCHQLWWRKFWTTASSIVAAEGGEKMAKSVPVRFQGGPTRFKTYEGSLSMFAVDRVLRMSSREKLSLNWLLSFDPESATHIKDQLGSARPSAAGYKNKKFYFGDERDGHFERDDLLCHYEGGEKVTDYVQVGDSVIPILESGRQGAAMKTTGNNDGRVARWSSSGEVKV